MLFTTDHTNFSSDVKSWVLSLGS